MISCRLATLDDAADFIEIYGPAIMTSAASFEEECPTLDEMRTRVAKVNPKYPWLVASENSQILGYAYASAHRERASYRWSVDVSVYVRQSAQRRSLGRTLYSKLIEILKIQGFHRAYAGITLPNAGSVALHESFGFKQIGVYNEVGFKFGKWHDVGWWQLELAKATASPKEPLPMSDVQNGFVV